MKLLTVFTTTILLLLLHSCALNHYQKISSEEIQRYHGTKAGCGLTDRFIVEYQNIELDNKNGKIKLSGKLLDRGPKKIPIPGVNVSIVEGKFPGSIIKKQINTDTEGRFELIASISSNDRLEISMIGYLDEYYELGKLLSSKKN